MGAVLVSFLVCAHPYADPPIHRRYTDSIKYFEDTINFKQQYLKESNTFEKGNFKQQYPYSRVVTFSQV